jgi:hypothetical protein
MTDFRTLLSALTGAGVEFLIVGGAAATAHGASRLTLDLDVVYRRTPANIERLAASLRHLDPYLRGAPPGLPFHCDEQTIFDLLGEITGGGNYDALLPDTIALELFGIQCRCLSLPCLIHVKRALGRPKDLDAIAELEAIKEERDG